MDYKKEDFVKETGISEKEIQELREAYVKMYAEQKGWNSDKLSLIQLNEIQQQDGYKKAGLLFS